jgi:hypothetical protein
VCGRSPALLADKGHKETYYLCADCNTERIEELDRLRAEAQWHYLPEMPEEEGEYLVAISEPFLSDCTGEAYWDGDEWMAAGVLGHYVYAWRELPQPPERE